MDGFLGLALYWGLHIEGDLPNQAAVSTGSRSK